MTASPLSLPLLFAVILAIVHVFVGSLRFLDVVPRSQWLSFAGGVSVAYVFVHVMPELAAGQAHLEEGGGVAGVVDHHVYLVALIGFAVYYGLERFAQRSRSSGSDGRPPERGAFWLHVASFAGYNAIVGYLLVRRLDAGELDLLFFFVAMALHVAVTDHGLRYHFRATYDRIGRWILAGAILLGWSVGTVTRVSAVILAALTAFLAGGIVLNAIKEELPKERESRFWAFAAGAGGYAVLLVSI